MNANTTPFKSLNLILFFLLLCPAFAYGTGVLNNELDVILSPLPQYTTSFSWGQPLKMMNDLTHYDTALTPRLRNLCNAPTQNGLLIVAPSEGLTPYLFARMAQLMASSAPQFKNCRKFTSAEIKTAPLIAGHSYVGDVEKAWQRIVLTTAKEEQVIFFLSNLEALLGLGSHEHKRTGLETELTASLQSHAIRLVTFLSEDQYKHILEDEDQKYTHVLESFGPPLFIQDFTFTQWSEFTKAYLKTLADDWNIAGSDLRWFFDLLTNYHPNQSEPKRTISFLQEIISNLSMNQSINSGDDEDKEISYTLDIKQEDTGSSTGPNEWILSYPGSRSLLLHFNNLFLDGNPSYTATGLSSFKPALRIYNSENQNPDKKILLDEISGDHPTPFAKGPYLASKILIRWEREVGSGSSLLSKKSGFALNQVTTIAKTNHLLTREEITAQLQKNLRIPDWIIHKDWKVLKQFESFLQQQFVGHSDLVEEVVSSINSGYLMGRRNKPLNSSLLIGPTGTGKSFLTQKVADILQLPRIVFDMTQYKDLISFRRFEKKLKKSLLFNPYAIYVFEEIDKVPPHFLDQLYFILDEGLYYPEEGRPLSAHHAIVFMTTNAGEEIVLHNPMAPLLTQTVLESLKNNPFRLSFLNRFDIKYVFTPFKNHDLEKLGRTLWDEYSQRQEKEHEWIITCDEAMIQFVASEGKDEQFGARPMERLIEKIISQGLTHLCLDQECYSIPSGSHIHFSIPQIVPETYKKIRFTISIMSTNTLKKEIIISK